MSEEKCRCHGEAMEQLIIADGGGKPTSYEECRGCNGERGCYSNLKDNLINLEEMNDSNLRGIKKSNAKSLEEKRQIMESSIKNLYSIEDTEFDNEADDYFKSQ